MTPSDFKQTLDRHGLALTRGVTSTLQINVGLACDLACRHCHLEAGPSRTELMDSETVEDVIACAGRFSFDTIDITGGAPELLPNLPRLVAGLAGLTPRLIVRSNLVALLRPGSEGLPELYRRAGAVIAASLPAVNASQTEAQRGGGVWDQSLAMLGRLNGLGYGINGSGLELDLVVNPSGAFLPPPQPQVEARFRRDLERRHGISFNNLFTFANVPLGRYRAWLEQTGNLDRYMETLKNGFNPATLAGLMCRALISVDWNGFLYDCDFNLAAGLYHGERPRHISELAELPAGGSPVPVGDHCYACMVGSGFT